MGEGESEDMGEIARWRYRSALHKVAVVFEDVRKPFAHSRLFRKEKGLARGHLFHFVCVLIT
eukprot:2029531-Amphidinium_carterae.2